MPKVDQFPDLGEAGPRHAPLKAGLERVTVIIPTEKVKDLGRIAEYWCLSEGWQKDDFERSA